MPKTRRFPDISYRGTLDRRKFYYHRLLNLPLPAFLGLLAALFAGIAALFALAFLLTGGIAGPGGDMPAKPIGLTYIHLSAPTGEKLIVESREDPKVTIGQPTGVAFNPADAMVFDEGGRRLR